MGNGNGATHCHAAVGLLGGLLGGQTGGCGRGGTDRQVRVSSFFEKILMEGRGGYGTGPD